LIDFENDTPAALKYTLNTGNANFPDSWNFVTRVCKTNAKLICTYMDTNGHDMGTDATDCGKETDWGVGKFYELYLDYLENIPSKKFFVFDMHPTRKHLRKELQADIQEFYMQRGGYKTNLLPARPTAEENEKEKEEEEDNQFFCLTKLNDFFPEDRELNLKLFPVFYENRDKFLARERARERALERARAEWIES